MLALGTFRASDLPAVDDFDALAAALESDRREDCAFAHAPRSGVAHTPAGLVRGVNLFGPGISADMTATPGSIGRMREVSSVLLNDCRFVGSSMSVIDRNNRVFLDGIDNLGAAPALAGFDPHYERDAAGRLGLRDEYVSRTTYIDCVALPVCGLGVPNYGHFLYDGLCVAWLHAQLLANRPLRIVGQPLLPWQREILAAVGLERHYLEVTDAVVFRRLLTTTLLALHVSYPTAFARPMFDMLRFRFGASGPAHRRVFFSRAADVTRRVLRNRAEVEARMAELGFEIVRPERLSFREQVRLMGETAFVAGESGAAMANLGFCQPGTRVLEIQPDRFVEGWTRGMCFQFAHRWHVYFAQVDSAPVAAADGTLQDPSQVFSFTVNVADLSRAVEAINTA